MEIAEACPKAAIGGLFLDPCRAHQKSGHWCKRSEFTLCLRFFDAGQCVRFVFGGLARVDKSDKVEAAGCRCR